MKLLEFMDEPELARVMKTLAQRIEDGCTIMGVEKPLFALVLFNDLKVGQYISNCTREDMIVALREAANRLERREDVERAMP
jgi:hypothetical protein